MAHHVVPSASWIDNLSSETQKQKQQQQRHRCQNVHKPRLATGEHFNDEPKTFGLYIIITTILFACAFAGHANAHHVALAVRVGASTSVTPFDATNAPDMIDTGATYNAQKF
eukprot:PhM_4_TR16091/c2_g3_i1/m.90104